MIEDLVSRFQERIRHQPSVDYLEEPSIKPRRPVSKDVLALAEAQLGFCLPPLLRALYTRVGDGGFGPGRGLDYLVGDEWSLIAKAEQTCVAAAAEESAWWPPKLVEFVSWGGHFTSCVDCSGAPYPIWFYNHDRNIGDATQADYLIPQAESLDEWLTAWLNGDDVSPTGLY